MFGMFSQRADGSSAPLGRRNLRTFARASSVGQVRFVKLAVPLVILACGYPIALAIRSRIRTAPGESGRRRSHLVVAAAMEDERSLLSEDGAIGPVLEAAAAVRAVGTFRGRHCARSAGCAGQTNKWIKANL